ncbi:MAG: LysR family transcriptional regulator, partial [Faecalibacillus sp.]
MIEMYQLEQLVAIYKSGTISKAAKDMHISQPGLTRSIQRLEKELGFDLFEHKKNKVTLNDNGLLAVKYAQKILNERDHMLIQLKKRIESQQTISIGSCTPAPIWALEFIFKKRYPEMKIKKEITSQKDELLEKLSHDHFSIVVIDHPVQDNRYLCFKLFEEHLYLSLPSLHPLANLKDISFQELDGQSVLLLSSIGLCNEICIKMMPHSHLLLQKNQDTFNELTKLS